jgi:hypothetical protein
MKNLLILMVIVVVIVAILILSGKSKEEDSNLNAEDDTPKSWLEIIEERYTYHQIIGAPLPETATQKKAQVHFNISIGKAFNTEYFFFVSTMPQNDFYALVEQLGLEVKPDLLEIWPEALDCSIKQFAENWTVTAEVDDNTFYGEDPVDEAIMLMKYENGKMYFKKEFTYITTVRTEDNELLYRKAKRGEQADPNIFSKQ